MVEMVSGGLTSEMEVPRKKYCRNFCSWQLSFVVRRSRSIRGELRLLMPTAQIKILLIRGESLGTWVRTSRRWERVIPGYT